MHAVCDVTDRNVRDVETLPYITPHALRHFLMNVAYGIAHMGHLQGKNGHEECSLFSTLLPSQLPELRPGHARFFDKAGKIMFHQIPRKPLDARFNGCMGRKCRASANDLNGLIEGKGLLRHQTGDAFEDKKCGMTLVKVVDARPDAQLLYQPDAAHAQKDLLLNPYPLVRRIKPVRYFSVLHGIPRNIRIQQV